MRFKAGFVISLLLFLNQVIVAQETSIRGFADVGLLATDDTGGHFDFELGQYDLYITSRLHERITFLGETVFEFDEVEGDFVVDVERVLIKYSVNNYLNIVAGKHHTPIGYWNTSYHHGSLLQPTVRRPLLFRFEDEGGILPIHTTGLLVQGDYITRFKFGYDLLIGNGIGSTPVGDNNDTKSVTARLRARPAEGLLVGASVYRDKLAAGTQTFRDNPLTGGVTQTILTGTLVYSKKPFELIAEVLRISNNPALVGRSTTTTGLYVYGGYRVGNLVPYFRYDRLEFDDSDPYFLPDDTKLFTSGMRYDFNFLSTVKLEYHYSDMDLEGSRHSFDIQFAVGF